MVRRTDRLLLQVRVSFEATRFGPQHLIEAYARLVPVVRQTSSRGSVTLYARVSSESQARDNTIARQGTALRERIAAGGFQLEPDHNYVDEGYSGATLFRPALGRLRDAIAGGQVEHVYVHAPDRLARRYAIKCS